MAGPGRISRILSPPTIMKLAANTILQQGRYRVIESFASTSKGVLYDAYDNLLGSKVVLYEHAIEGFDELSSEERAAVGEEFSRKAKLLGSLRHEGIVRVREGFATENRQYLATEAVESGFNSDEFLHNPAETISRLLSAIDTAAKLDDDHTSPASISPLTIRQTPDGNNRILYFGESEDASVTPYKPLELVWDGLDVASRKVISNDYDEDALTLLQARPDLRSSLYTLAASIYEIVGAASPADALERSVELLESGNDPLSFNNLPEAICPFLQRSLALRREDRFESAEAAAAALPGDKAAFAAADSRSDNEEVEPHDEIDTLLNQFPTAANEKAASTRHEAPSAIAAASGLNADQRGLDAVADAPIFDPMPSSSAGLGKIIAIAAAAVVVVGIAIFVLGGMSGSGESTAAAAASPAAEKTTPANVSSEQQTISPAPAGQAAPSGDAAVQTSAVQPDRTSEKRLREAAADAKPLRKEDKKPEPKPVAAKKKAVTVDDLISDN